MRADQTFALALLFALAAGCGDSSAGTDAGSRDAGSDAFGSAGLTFRFASSPGLPAEIRDGKKALDPVVLLDSAVTQVASVE